MPKFYLLIFSLIPLALTAEPATVHLINPLYCDGRIATDEGGVLTSQLKGCDLRIQAQKINYCNEENASKIVAEGNLMVLYGKSLFTGAKVEYDLLAGCGIIYEGRMASDPWFTGGSRILLYPKGHYEICHGYLTSCEEGKGPLYLASSKISICCNRWIKAEKTTLFVAGKPFISLPTFTADLKSLEDLPIQLKISWGGFLGTAVSLRYRFWSNEEWRAYARLDYIFNRGPGGGLETEYCALDKFRTIYTRSYAAYDRSFDDPQNRLRYRFTGRYDENFCEESLQACLVYDFLSDSEMASDFEARDFDLETGEQTELTLTKKDPNWIAELKARARANSFQSIKQELPYLRANYRPFEIGESGIISSNNVKAGYLDYVYAKGTPGVENFRSTRIELNHALYRPFHLSGFHITPGANFVGIFYGNNPQGRAAAQAVAVLDLEVNAPFHRIYGCYKHTVTPYFHLQSITAPTASVEEHFIFSIADAYARLNYIRFGTTSYLYYKEPSEAILPILSAELWTNAFINVDTLTKSIPKIYGRMKWKISPFLISHLELAWNRENSKWDYFNLGLGWTASDNLAFKVDYLSRGPLDFRKADRDNFILDAVRSVSELEASPLSDKRSTFLSHLFYRFHPDWSVEFKSRHGWRRKLEPSYNEYRIDLNTAIFCGWNLKLTYEHREDEDRFSFSLRLGQRYLQDV